MSAPRGAGPTGAGEGKVDERCPHASSCAGNQTVEGHLLAMGTQCGFHPVGYIKARQAGPVLSDRQHGNRIGLEFLDQALLAICALDQFSGRCASDHDLIMTQNQFEVVRSVGIRWRRNAGLSWTNAGLFCAEPYSLRDIERLNEASSGTAHGIKQRQAWVPAV